MSKAFVALIVFGAACSNGQPVSQGEASLEVTVTETANELTLVGVDPENAEVGRVHVQLGRFVMQDDGRTVDGRQLEVFVAGDKVRHESEGYRRLTLPGFTTAEHDVFNDFLYDARVRETLARWQIDLGERPLVAPVELTPQPTVQGESAYAACTSPPPNPGCGMTSCAQRPAWQSASGCYEGIEQLVCCGTTKLAARRACGYGAQNTCGAEGPNGCAVCWTYSWSSSCTATSGSARTLYCWDGDTQLSLSSQNISISYN